MSQSVFLLGTGYIGGSILTGLIDAGYQVTALSRSADKARELNEMNVKTVIGTLDDEDKIVQAVKEHKIIIHAATADHQPSVRAILKGLEQRDASEGEAVYIHTSGTGVITGEPDPERVFSDRTNADLDSLPDDAWHRDVDLLIKRAVDNKKLAGKAKVAIMLPPTIYGLGTGPFNRLSIDVPAWIRESLKEGQVKLYGEEHYIWNDIHIRNLVQAYLKLLEVLVNSTEQPEELYAIAETNQHNWHELGHNLHSLLKARGLIESERPVKADKQSGYGMDTYSRSKSERLPALGWKGESETKQTITEALKDELDAVLEEQKQEAR